MSQLAIKGHATRGREVIQLLKMLGGENKYSAQGNCTEVLYFIYDNKSIKYLMKSDARTDLMKVFTLEEFEEKFPYKVGDKVKCWINGYCSINNIKDIQWDGIVNEIKYRIQDYWYSTINLQPYKEETMKEKNEKSTNHVFDTEIISFDIAQRDKYELDLQGKFEVVLREGKYYVERIKSQYPKTYEECCNILGIDTQFCMKYLHHGTFSYNDKMIYNLQELLICRDAYWKIAGKEMGLDKPWKPDFTNIDNCYLAIKTCKGEISLISTLYIEDCILVFPTEEMRDAFYENFKSLIEECKELL